MKPLEGNKICDVTRSFYPIVFATNWQDVHYNHLGFCLFKKSEEAFCLKKVMFHCKDGQLIGHFKIQLKKFQGNWIVGFY
jgi:hypothetical protein